MSNANIVLKSVIKNIDDYLTKPMIRSLYDWNMTWNENELVKSDMRIIARGSTTDTKRSTITKIVTVLIFDQ